MSIIKRSTLIKNCNVHFVTHSGGSWKNHFKYSVALFKIVIPRDCTAETTKTALVQKFRCFLTLFCALHTFYKPKCGKNLARFVFNLFKIPYCDKTRMYTTEKPFFQPVFCNRNVIIRKLLYSKKESLIIICYTPKILNWLDSSWCFSLFDQYIHSNNYGQINDSFLIKTIDFCKV